MEDLLVVVLQGLASAPGHTSAIVCYGLPRYGLD